MVHSLFSPPHRPRQHYPLESLVTTVIGDRPHWLQVFLSSTTPPLEEAGDFSGVSGFSHCLDHLRDMERLAVTLDTSRITYPYLQD